MIGPALPTRSRRVLLALVALSFASCGGDDTVDAGGGATDPNPSMTTEAPQAGETLFPDVVDAEVMRVDGDEYQVAATLSSPYDSPERYADAWRVLDEDGVEIGVRELAHDHADEQPFTRTLRLSIPADVDEITVEGRDQVSGYGGETVTVTLPSG